MSVEVRDGDTVIKAPGASRVYVWDWTADLGSAEIDTSTWAITPNDGVLTSDNTGIVTGNQKTTIRLIGGTLGTKYKVVNTITTNSSPVEIEPATLNVKCANQ